MINNVNTKCDEKHDDCNEHKKQIYDLEQTIENIENSLKNNFISS